MAKTAELGGNQAEALTYYNRALEIDPTISDAWIGKGRAAAWQSTMANIRLPEALIAFNHAISNSPSDQKDAVRQLANTEVNSLVSTLYGMCRNHLEEFASLPDTWPAYLNQVKQFIDALEEARQWVPHDRITLENIVHLCRDNIEGHISRDQFNYNAEITHGISESYEALLHTHLDGASDELKKLDPSYEPPQIVKKKGSDCFVVTATMGGSDHPDVRLLRQFRDQWISKQRGGEKAIAAYYVVGPPLASAIRRSRFMRAASRLLIVSPAARFARKRLSDARHKP